MPLANKDYQKVLACFTNQLFANDNQSMWTDRALAFVTPLWKMVYYQFQQAQKPVSFQNLYDLLEWDDLLAYRQSILNNNDLKAKEMAKELDTYIHAYDKLSPEKAKELHGFVVLEIKKALKAMNIPYVAEI